MSAAAPLGGRLRPAVTAELVGTFFLVAVVVGSGIMATRLSDDVGVQLLANSLATGAGLLALIRTLQPVSAAFNPVVTLAEVVLGQLIWRDAVALVGAQVVGGSLGAVAANLMFEQPALSLSGHERGGPGLWLGEVVATAGLLLVVAGLTRAGRSDSIAGAVAAFITAAYWFTSSTSFANPAVTIARMWSDSFAGIAPASVPAFVVVQLVGGAIGIGLVRLLHPAPAVPVPDLSGEAA